MSLALELPADVLAELDAEAVSQGTSPESIITTMLRNHFATADNAAPTFAEGKPPAATPEAITTRFADDLAWEGAWWNTLSESERDEYNRRERDAFDAAEAQMASGRRGHTTPEVAERIRARYAAEHGRK